MAKKPWALKKLEKLGLRHFDGKTWVPVDVQKTKKMAKRFQKWRKQHKQNIRILKIKGGYALYAQKGKGGVY